MESGFGLYSKRRWYYRLRHVSGSTTSSGVKHRHGCGTEEWGEGRVVEFRVRRGRACRTGGRRSGDRDVTEGGSSGETRGGSRETSRLAPPSPSLTSTPSLLWWNFCRVALGAIVVPECPNVGGREEVGPEAREAHSSFVGHLLPGPKTVPTCHEYETTKRSQSAL